MSLFQPAAVRALAERTLRSSLEGPLAAAALIAFYLIGGALFALPLFLSGQASLHGLLDSAPLLLTLVAPALTMGLLAEELRAGTFETLATSPLEDWDIVLGKFLGYAALLGLLVGGLLLYPLSLSLVAVPPGLDWGAALGTLAALYLQGLLFGAVGLFASSLTRSQASAYLAGFGGCFVFFSCGRLAALLPGALGAAAAFAGVDGHMGALAKGVLDLRDLGWFATGIAGFLLLAAQRLEARRLRRRGLTAAFTAAALGGLLAVNAVLAFSHARLDLSQGRAHSLSKGSRAALQALKDPVLVEVFFTRGLPPPFSLHERHLRDLLEDFRSASRGRMKVTWADPARDGAALARAKEAGIVPVQVNTAGHGSFEAKTAVMGLTLLSGGKAQTIPVVDQPADLEYQLALRLKRLAGAKPPRVGFVQGHGEPAPPRTDELEAVAVKLDEPLPEGLDALWLIGPNARLKPAEVQALAAFAKSGKTLAVAAGTRLADFMKFQASPVDAGLAPLLSAWGLTLRPGLVADRQCERISLQTPMGRASTVQVVDYSFLPVATRLRRDHPAVTGLSAVPFPFASPLQFDAAAAPGTGYVSLADSSPTSTLYGGGDISPRDPPPGPPGPFSLAGTARGPAGTLLLLGTAYHFDPRVAPTPAVQALLQNLVEWSAGDETLLSARGRGQVYRPLAPLPPAGAAAFRWLLILALPVSAGAGLAGLAAARARRRRSLPALYADA
jgi:hypothetical protein